MAELQGQLRRIYSGYRTADFNRRYYACRLRVFRRWNLVTEIAVAVGTSAAVGGWRVFQSRPGAAMWAVIGAVAVLASILKPILDLGKKIERNTKLYVGYLTLANDYRVLVDDLKEQKSLLDTASLFVRQSEQRFNTLSVDDDPNPSERLLWRCYEETKRELKTADWWWPKEETHEPAST